MLLRLGLLKDDEPISGTILERYTKLFDEPLAADVVQAFADFYGWRVPPEMLASLTPPSSRLVEI